MNNPNATHSSPQGFTLIEVMIFTAVVAIVLVMLVAMSVNITRQSRISAHKIYATHYANELSEWLRFQKDISWQAFYDKSQDAGIPPTIYCVNNELLLSTTLADLTSPLINPTDCGYSGILDGNLSTPQIFRRTVSFDGQPDNTKGVKATILVEWQEVGSMPYSVRTQTIFAPR